MSAQHPFILFVGNPGRGEDLLNRVESLGWWVYLPEDDLEALGMYITYAPDVVVLDAEAAPEIAVNVYHHLSSVHAAPLLVLTSDSTWDAGVSNDIYLLPPGIGRDALAARIAAVVGNRETENA